MDNRYYFEWSLKKGKDVIKSSAYDFSGDKKIDKTTAYTIGMLVMSELNDKTKYNDIKDIMDSIKLDKRFILEDK